MAEFTGDDLSGARFERVRLIAAEFRATDLSNARVLGADRTGAVLRGVDLVDARIDGDITNLVINGVEVAPLVEAELDRRDPGRAMMRPTDPAGFRQAWDMVERYWDGTVARARGFDPERLHQSVLRAILGDPAPWHPLDLPWDEMADTPGVPRDREVRPTLEEVLALRRDRMTTVRELIDGLTEQSLAAHTEPVEGPGWPPAKSFPVRECLHVVLDEEWQHRQYAERDLDALAAAEG
jgi:hypothetical protein